MEMKPLSFIAACILLACLYSSAFSRTLGEEDLTTLSPWEQTLHDEEVNRPNYRENSGPLNTDDNVDLSKYWERTLIEQPPNADDDEWEKTMREQYLEQTRLSAGVDEEWEKARGDEYLAFNTLSARDDDVWEKARDDDYFAHTTLSADVDEEWEHTLDADNTESHEECINAWGLLSRAQNATECISPIVIRKYAEKCKIPELREKMDELHSNCGVGNPKKFLAVVTDAEKPEQRLPKKTNSTINSRSKRFVLANPKDLWTDGKVPYIDGDSHSYKRAMKTFERFTCIRFYPWSKNGDTTTNDELGLDHQSYLKFVYEGGCWADQGNKRYTNGQKVSCCGGTTCLHEIGHALGSYHEHQNPLGKGIIRLNPKNAESAKVFNFRETAASEDTYSTGFDMTSIMGYGQTTFTNGNGEVISWLFSDIQGGSDWYYLLMEISNVHKCDELYCSDFKMECVNDGYLTLVDNVCGCMCPPGLDPNTGCSTVLKDTTSIQASEVDAAQDIFDVDISSQNENTGAESSIKWPVGQYALPQTTEGCPSSKFSSGSRVHTGAAPSACADSTVRGCKFWKQEYGCDGNPSFMHKECPATCEVCYTFGNHNSTTFHLSGTTNQDQVELDFCVKEDTSDDDADFKWPAGQYCIYRNGGSCPDGFDTGSVTFTDEDHSSSSNSESGSVPDGEFTSSSTKLEFCCTKYGFVGDALVLPRTKPFALLKSADKDENRCHDVRGMHKHEGYTAVKNSGGSPTIEGETPVLTLDSGKNTHQIPYCYYVPTEKADCGDVIELTEAKPTATITGSSGKDLMCNWLVKAPETSRILLNFDEFNVAADDNGDCIDKVGIRYNRLGSSGFTFCGDTFQKSISTVNNTLRVVYDTFTTAQSSFTATVSLISEDNLCYNVADKGHTYVGNVDRTRAMKQCIPWVQAAGCPHNPFNDADTTHNLQDNFCRNPDTTDGLRPWCYTNATGCQRQYCDVCLFENVYDTSSNCDILAKMGFCENDPNVLQDCAGTCKSNIPTFAQPNLAKDVTCSAPGPVSDGDIVGSTKSSYAVGEVVTYTCKDTSKLTSKERKCLTTGEWSSLNYVCTECEMGWVYRNGYCHKLFTDSLRKADAVAACNDIGASLATVFDEAENTFMAGINFWYGTWLDATDEETEGEWIWRDGSPVTWTNWMSGQPDDYYSEDCVWMTGDGKWEDRWCSSDKYTYICVKREFEVTNCDDLTDDCANFYSNDPNVCVSQSEFMHRNCKKTCGLCNPTSCSVEPASTNAQLTNNMNSVDQGSVITYACKSGFHAVSGDAVRGCLADGSMSGQSLECQANEVTTSESEMKKIENWGSQMANGYVYTGEIPGFIIPQDGKISRWEFWSTDVGEGALQVWRTTGDENKFEFVGQNMVTTPDDYSATYYVPEAEQIAVKQGDVIGIYYGNPKKAGIGYTKCETSEYPGSEKLKVLNAQQTDPQAFTAGSSYDFKVETNEVCRIYRFRAIVAP